MNVCVGGRGKNPTTWLGAFEEIFVPLNVAVGGRLVWTDDLLFGSGEVTVSKYVAVDREAS
jgi:hypothetical protein